MTELSSEPRFIAGIGEFNAQSFFEAHEIWEDLWNDLVGDSKQVCQGLIQIAAGYHKLSIGNPPGARKLLERGARSLTSILPDVAWAKELADHVSRDLQQLKGGATQLAGDPPRLPSMLD